MATIRIKTVIITETGVETSDDLLAGIKRQLDQFLTELEAFTVVAKAQAEILTEQDDQ